MSFVKFNENGYFTDKNGNPMYLIGINYSPRGKCGCFWKETWDPEMLIRDLDMIKDMGLNCIRFPVHWYAFEPEEGKMDALMLERLDWFIAMCRERELYIQPWFLVGVANGMFEVPWRNGRSFLSDETMILAEEKHISVFAKRYREEECILAWDICDEPEWFCRMGGQAETLPYNREMFAAWTRRMYHAFKNNDPNHMVTLGVGQLITGNYGMDVRDMAETLDVMGLTLYYYEDGIDKARCGFLYNWNTDMNRTVPGRSVYLCEAPGATWNSHFEEEISGHYESVIYGTWLHGSVGAMPWQFCRCPKDLWTSPIVNEYMMNPGWGIVDEEGSLKEHGKTLAEIAAVMKKINAPQFKLRQPKAAILIPEGYHSHVDKCFPELRDTYAALIAADVPVETVWISDEYEKYPFLIISSTYSSGIIPHMVGASYKEPFGYFTNAEYLRLKRYVENGGNLLFLPRMQATSPVFTELFGATFGTPASLDDDNDITFTTEIGRFKSGEKLQLDSVNKSYRRLRVKEAEVLATVDGEWPFIIQNRVGKGQVIYMAADIFNGFYKMSANQWNNSPLFGLMADLMERLGVERPVVCADPNVECGIMESTLEDLHLVLIINRNDKACEQSVYVKNMGSYKPVTIDGEPVSYSVRGDDLELIAPFAARKATLVILKRV